jgi:acyl-CoA reductase-like NAD-dependent aldehyde dehydrogenase
MPTTEVRNPATGATVGAVETLDGDGTRALVERARRAQPGWERAGFDGRAEVMYALRRWLVDERDRVLRTLVSETGKPWVDAQLELFYVCDALGFWAKRAPRFLADETAFPHTPFLWGRKLVNRYRPYGVVGVIGPWNYPLVNNFGDAVPALMAGNAVVLKPASITPLSSELMAEGLRAIGAPEDVFLVANGSGSTVGAALVDSVDMLHFTGSTEVGKDLAVQAAKRLLPITLELGGNDAMIVCADADVDRAANAAVWGAMQNGGQTCISVERVYVEAPIHDAFVAKVAANVRELRQATGEGPGEADVGAVTSPDQLETLDEHVRDAVDKGARVEAGGRRRPGAGTFFEPTVLSGVDHTMKIMREETFGPTLPIMRVADVEEAIRLANDSNLGLDGSVFAGSAARGEEIARRMETGAVVVNDAIANYFATEIPIGGVKESGVGARHGRIGIQKYCQRQNIVVTRFGLAKELYYFPYSRFTARLLDVTLVALFKRGGRRRRR